MTDAALLTMDAYIRRERGPPGRADCRLVSDTLRDAQAALADALSREQALLAEIERLKTAAAKAEAMLAGMSARERQAIAALERCTEAMRLHDEVIAEMSERVRKLRTPAAIVSVVEIAGVCAMACWGGWLAHG